MKIGNILNAVIYGNLPYMINNIFEHVCAYENLWDIYENIYQLPFKNLHIYICTSKRNSLLL